MPTVFLDGFSFSGLAQTFKLLANKHTETRIWNARSLDRISLRQAYGLGGYKGSCVHVTQNEHLKDPRNL
jgi:hypothetical protein